MADSKERIPRFGGRMNDKLSVFETRFGQYEDSLRRELSERARSLALLNALEGGVLRDVQQAITVLRRASDPEIGATMMDNSAFVRVALWAEHGIMAHAMRQPDANDLPGYAAQLERLGARSLEDTLGWVEELYETMAPTVAARTILEQGFPSREVVDCRADDELGVARYYEWVGDDIGEYGEVLARSTSHMIVHMAYFGFKQKFLGRLASVYNALNLFIRTKFGSGTTFSNDLVVSALDEGGIGGAIKLLRRAQESGHLAIFKEGRKDERSESDDRRSSGDKKGKGRDNGNGRKAGSAGKQHGQGGSASTEKDGARKEAQRDADRERGACFKCHKVGHQSRECPEVGGKGGMIAAVSAVEPEALDHEDGDDGSIAMVGAADYVMGAAASGAGGPGGDAVDAGDDEDVGAWTHEGTLKVDGEVRTTAACVLFDSGATTCAVSKRAIERYRLPFVEEANGQSFQGVGGRVRTEGYVRDGVTLAVGEYATSLANVRVFAALPGGTDIVLGYGRLRSMGVLAPPMVAAVERAEGDFTFADIAGEELAQTTDRTTGVDDQMMSVWLPDGERTAITSDDLSMLTAQGIAPTVVARLVSEINERAWRDGAQLGMTVPPVRLRMRGDAPPQRIVYRQRSPELIRVQREEIERLLRGNLIQRVPKVQASRLPWVTVPTFPMKSDGTRRFAIDFRNINTGLVVESRTELPKEEEFLSHLAENAVFTTFDAVKGYWQLRLSEESRLLTAFVDLSSPDKDVYVFKVLPFGLTNAGDIFAATMGRCLQGTNVQYYIDDFAIGAPDVEKAIEYVFEFLEVCRRYNIFVRVAKAQLFRSAITMLGREVSAKGVTIPEAAMQGIRDLAVPKSKDDVRSVYQSLTWWSRFVEGFSVLGAPISDLLKGERRFKWGEEQQRAYDALKAAICARVHLLPPDYTQPMVLKVDSSRLGVGAVLYRTDGGEWRVVACVSSKWSATQAGYRHIGELEALGIVWAVLKLEDYLTGVRHPFVILTDHRPLVTLFGGLDRVSSSVTARRIRRWAEILAHFNFIIRHIPGVEMGLADVMSRFPSSQDALLEPREVGVVAAVGAAETTGTSATGELGAETVLPPSAAVDDAARRQAIVGVIRIIHAQLSHAGTARVEAHVRARYPDWKGVRDIVRMVAETCKVCDEAGRARESETVVPLRPLPIVTRPMARVALDILVLPRSAGGARYVLGGQDAATKFLWLVPLASRATEDVTLALRLHILPWGTPVRLHHDPAAEFTSSEFVEFCRREAIECHTTTVDRHQSNGQIERAFSTALDWARKEIIQARDERWEVAVAKAGNTYNRTVNSTTGKTPFELMRGELPQLPIDRIIGWEPRSAFVDEEDLRARLTAAQEAQKAVADQRAALAESPAFVAGDIVRVRVRTSDRQANKLGARWSDECKVLKAADGQPDYYVVRAGRRNMVKHVSDLKLAAAVEAATGEQEARAEAAPSAAPMVIPAAADRPERLERPAGQSAFVLFVWQHPWSATASAEDVRRTRAALSTAKGRKLTNQLGSAVRSWMAFCGANNREIREPPSAAELTAWASREPGASATKTSRMSLLKRAYRFVTDAAHRQSTVERLLAKGQ